MEIATRPKQRESFGSLYGSLYLTDIEQEKSAKSLSPFINAQLCYNRLGHIPTNPEVHFNHRLFYLNGWDVNHLEQITERTLERYRAYKEYSEGEILAPCSVVIHQGLRATLDYFFVLYSCIRQPIERLLVFGHDNPCSGDFTAISRPAAISGPRWRIRNMTTEEYEPTSPMKNLSESAISSFASDINPFNAVNVEHLTIVVLHKVNCQYLAKSLNECKRLIHLTYFKCRDPSFEALGNNKGLEEISVEHCTLGANAEAELFAQLRYLTKLEKISLRSMRCEKYLAKLTKEGVLSSLELLKSISLQQCILTTPTVVALMKSLAQCPLMEINLSDNFLFGFIKELHQTPDVSFRHLERMKWQQLRSRGS